MEYKKLNKLVAMKKKKKKLTHTYRKQTSDHQWEEAI